MKRKDFVVVTAIFFTLLLCGSAGGYLLSPRYVMERMIQNYRALRSITAVQRVEAYGEEATYPFASVDEKVEILPFLPLKIWVEGKEITSDGKIDPEMNVNHFLIAAQRRYGFYKDVFMNHEMNLLKILLKRLGIVPVMARLRLVYPWIAYQIGAELTAENLRGLWIDKDRFIPLRLVGTLTKKEEGFPDREEVDVRYGDYRLLQEKMWYPFDVKFFVNGKLVMRIRVSSATLKTYE